MQGYDCCKSSELNSSHLTSVAFSWFRVFFLSLSLYAFTLTACENTHAREQAPLAAPAKTAGQIRSRSAGVAFNS